MKQVLQHAIALTRLHERSGAAASLGELLGGERVIVFVRDAETKAMLPAPGFPQTLPNGRAWRALLAGAVTDGASSTSTLAQPGDAGDIPAFAIAAGPDVAMVILGTGTANEYIDDVRDLLPLIGASYVAEMDAASARTLENLAHQAEARADALALALDRSRAEVQQALARAEESRAEVAIAYSQLQDAAAETEAQAAELETQTDELQQANELLDQARLEAENANVAKSEFLATMSHELRTPLNAIGGYVQLMAMGLYGPVSDEQREALTRIDRGQRHLLGLITDILNFAKIQAGRIEYHPEAVRVSTLFKDLVPMLEPRMHEKELNASIEPIEDGLCVYADCDKLQQILLNLLSNAVKFVEPGGSIRVGATTTGGNDTVILFVADTGIGIPTDKLAAIFEPFVQVDASHSRVSQGTGLGLAISRDLARGMGGDLSVQSTVGKGSRFEVTLPRVTP